MVNKGQRASPKEYGVVVFAQAASSFAATTTPQGPEPELKNGAEPVQIARSPCQMVSIAITASPETTNLVRAALSNRLRVSPCPNTVIGQPFGGGVPVATKSPKGILSWRG